MSFGFLLVGEGDAGRVLPKSRHRSCRGPELPKPAPSWVGLKVSALVLFVRDAMALHARSIQGGRWQRRAEEEAASLRVEFPFQNH